ncbi:MAG: hypothetical protein QOC62_2868 [Mycobacterium sp.]|nr:hypothetical protein [Mycobacterium sp.]
MPAEVFDEQRRAWIAAHAGVFMFQKRRAELLGKKIRSRGRDRIGVRPDPHDDQVTPALAFRSASTTTGALESGLVAVIALTAPLGWPLGRLLYGWITTLIPEKLRAYPIPALIWSAVVCGLPLPVLFDPAPGLISALITPWLLAQIPATFLAAGAYGVLEGWLSVDGSTDWWPMTPTQPDVDEDLILGRPGELIMPTVLDPASPDAEPMVLPRGRRPPKVRWLPILSGAALVAIGAAWYGLAVLTAVMSNPAETLQATIDQADGPALSAGRATLETVRHRPALLSVRNPTCI